MLKLFDMTIAMTGLNERAAQAAGLDYDKMYTYNQSHASYYPGGHGISMKVLYEKGTGRLLGAQLIGYDGVDKRCDVLATAIRANMTAFDLTELELCYAPPFGSAKDPVNYAGYAIENVLTGKVKTFHWHDVATLPRDGSVTLLDVRTPRNAPPAPSTDSPASRSTSCASTSMSSTRPSRSMCTARAACAAIWRAASFRATASTATTSRAVTASTAL